MGLQTASRPARRQAWYIYGPIFFHHEPGFSRRPARDDPSLLGLSRAGLAGYRPARRPMATGLESAGPGASACCRPARRARAAGIYIRFFFKFNLLLLFFFSKKLHFFFFFFFKNITSPVTHRSVLAGCRHARRQSWYGWPWVCRPRAARRGVKPGIYMGQFFGHHEPGFSRRPGVTRHS